MGVGNLKSRVSSQHRAATSIVSGQRAKNKTNTIMAWRMLKAMPENQAIMLGMLGGFAVTTGMSKLCKLSSPQTIVNRTKKTYQKIRGYPYYSTSFANQKSLNTTPHCIQVPTNGQNKWRLFYCGLYVEPWLYAASTLFYPFLPLKLQTVFFLNFTLFRDSKVIVFPSVEHVQTVVSLCH